MSPSTSTVGTVTSRPLLPKAIQAKRSLQTQLLSPGQIGSVAITLQNQKNFVLLQALPFYRTAPAFPHKPAGDTESVTYLEVDLLFCYTSVM